MQVFIYVEKTLIIELSLLWLKYCVLILNGNTEFSADQKHAEFGTRDFTGKNLQRNLQLIF